MSGTYYDLGINTQYTRVYTISKVMDVFRFSFAYFNKKKFND